MANGTLCICHEPEVPTDVFPGPAKQSDAATAVPPLRQSHLLAEGGFSLTTTGIATPTVQTLALAMPESPLAADTFLELVPLLLSTWSPLSVTLTHLGLPRRALKPSCQQDEPH